MPDVTRTDATIEPSGDLLRDSGCITRREILECVLAADKMKSKSGARCAPANRQSVQKRVGMDA